MKDIAMKIVEAAEGEAHIPLADLPCLVPSVNENILHAIETDPECGRYFTRVAHHGVAALRINPEAYYTYENYKRDNEQARKAARRAFWTEIRAWVTLAIALSAFILSLLR